MNVLEVEAGSPRNTLVVIKAVLFQAQVKNSVRRHDCEFPWAPAAAPNSTCDPAFHETRNTDFGCLSEQNGDSFLNCLCVRKPSCAQHGGRLTTLYP